MKNRWTYFIGAVILAGYVLLSSGAPPVSVALGIGFAAMLTRRASPSA
jgi:hypothetical protein